MNKQQEHLQTIVKNYRPIEQLIPPHWSEGDIFANSIRQHYYRTGGEKPPLLLLHGFNEYGLTWLRVAKELERDNDIIKIMYFENTGHLIRRVAFEQYMTLVHRPGAFALLSIGNGRLGLLKYGQTHIEFDTPDPDTLYQLLKEAGMPVEEPPTLKGWGEYDFTIHDLDGHCLEFDSPYHGQPAASNPPVQG